MVIDGTTRDSSHAYNPLIGSILPRAAGTGIAELISQAMAEAGMDIHEARRRNVLFDKEEALDDVERRFPAERYVLVDDKPRNPGGGQALLRWPRHDRFRAAGQLCPRSAKCRRLAAGRCHDRTHRR